MTGKQFKHSGLGGSVRLESGELHSVLDQAFAAGVAARVAGLPCRSGYVTQDQKAEFRRGWNSVG